MNLDLSMQIENVLFTLALIAYVVSMVAYFITAATKKDKPAVWASRIIKIGFIAHTLAIIVRGLGAQRVPLSNQYEFATAFAWGIALFFIIFEKKYEYRSMGAFITPILVLIIGYAALQNKEVRPLMPALQSGWLAVHVSLAVLGYGSFAVAAGISIMYLVKRKKPEMHLPAVEKLDEISYNAIKVGFLCLTLCILTGAIWAQYSWGRFWAWDPKETWSLITWIIYAVYLHIRRTRSIDGKVAAWFAILGFLAVIFTYIGVNTLLPSLHSYA